MHPLKFLMDEINRDYWGIPDKSKQRVRRADVPLIWPIVRWIPRERRK